MSQSSRVTARDVALDVLLAVVEDEAYSNLLLPHRITQARLGEADAALATELTYGTLRLTGYYDAVIAIAAGRPVAKIDVLARVALELGAHQLLGTRVAQHAAVNETVSAVRQRGGRGVAGFVNANLRTIAAADAQTWRERVAERESGALARVSRLGAHPKWIARAVRDALDLEGRGGELEAALSANNVSPKVQLAALPGLANREAMLTQQGELLVAEPASPVALQLRGGDPLDVPEVASGTARVQDAGSQLVALALTRCTPLVPGERLLDLCAGPGGKAAMLAAEARLAGAELSANEVMPARAKLVRDALATVGDASEFPVSVRDGREIADQSEQFDRILLDAPCTGLGALRRRPEARWRKRPADVAELTALQEELLHAAVRALKPGGILAYVTCSPHPAETIGVVKRELRTAERGELSVLDAAAVCRELAPTLELPGLPLGDGTAVQLWPHRHGTDAMFLALLRKRPDTTARNHEEDSAP